jgi:hypothetical protein
VGAWGPCSLFRTLFSNGEFKDQDKKLKSKKQNQQANYSKETSLKGKGENQYLIQTALICSLSTTLSAQFYPGFLGRDCGVPDKDRVPLGGAEMEKQGTLLLPPSASSAPPAPTRLGVPG